jgi:hypothetical protein
LGKSRPLDPVLRARLHLAEGARIRLGLIRAVLATTDGVSRGVTGKPFFALREAEDLLRQVNGVKGADLVREILRWQGGTQIVPQGLDHVPQTGAVVIASTHPTGMFDFIAHAGALLSRRPDLKVVANQEVELFLGPDILVPVRIDKTNRAISAKEVHRGMQRHLGQGGALLIFGSGRVADRRDGRLDGRLAEPVWRSGASRISAKCDVPLIPAGLAAQNSDYYYRLRRLAQTLKRGDDNFGAMIGSLRYMAELLDKLGGHYQACYGAALPAGTPPEVLKEHAEGLVPQLYR